MTFTILEGLTDLYSKYDSENMRATAIDRLMEGGKTRRWFLKASFFALVARMVKDAEKPDNLKLGRLRDSGNRIVGLDPEFDRLISRTEGINRLHTDCTWSEGPN